MNYSNLNLTTNTDFNTISILPGQDINIFKYLPIEDKNDIIQIALQNSDENGLFNLLKVKMFFELYIVYSYTDIVFTVEEKDDPTKLYNELKSNGILDAILSSIEPPEYQYLVEVLKETMEAKAKYRSTVASVIHGFIENLPINANAAKDIIDKFDPAAFQRVIDFATAANGNRPIN